MEQKAAILQNKGMNQDTSISKTSNEFAFENFNIRITGDNENTLLSVTNEKGPLKMQDIPGTYLGHCVIGKYLVIFTVANDTSFITRVDVDNNQLKMLYSGNLGFDLEHPIETLAWYETEDIQKVYWVDGKNYPRVINIVKDNVAYNQYSFDFAAHVESIPYVTVNKDYSKSGLFKPGTIQYFITYYNKFGAETPIVWQSPLQYVSFQDRGGKPDENISCGFNINVSNIDTSYEYLRLYSAQRTSNNGPIYARLVADVKIIGNKLDYTDLGTQGSAIDYTMLSYLGGSTIVASTLAQKDGTLFIGDLKIESTSYDPDFKAFIESFRVHDPTTGFYDASLVAFGYKTLGKTPESGYYEYNQEINEDISKICTFKYGEIYRFAIQFMTPTGEWTYPIWIGDKECTLAPKTTDGVIKVADVSFDSSEITDYYEHMENINYVSFRLLMAETSPLTRRILAQGVVNPTMFNFYERFNNQPHAIASWNFRPRGSSMANKHLEALPTQYDGNAEIQGVTSIAMPIFEEKTSASSDQYSNYLLCVGADEGHELIYKLVYFNLPSDKSNTSVNKIKDILNGTTKIEEKTSAGSSDVYYKEIINSKSKKSSWDNTIEDAYSNISAAANNAGISLPISRTNFLDRTAIKKAMNKRNGGLAWAYIGEALAICAAIAITVVSYGSMAAAGAAIIATATGALLATIGTAAMSVSILGVGAVVKTAKANNSDDIERSLNAKGWMSVTSTSDKQTSKPRRLGYASVNDSSNGVFSAFKNSSRMRTFNGVTDNDGVFFMCGGPLTYKSVEEFGADKNKDKFYTDNNIVTINSPEIEDNKDLIVNNQSLDFRIIGRVPVNAVYSKYRIDTETKGFNINSDVIRNALSKSASIKSPNIEGLLNDYLYQDSDIIEGGVNHGAVQGGAALKSYKVFTWNKPSLSVNKGIGGITLAEAINGDNVIPIDYIPAKIKSKLFANQRFSTETEYFENTNHWYPKNGSAVNIFSSDEISVTSLKGSLSGKFYYGNYDNLITFTSVQKYPVITVDNVVDNDARYPYGRSGIPTESSPTLELTDPVRIRYKETPHAVVSFNNDAIQRVILPRLKNETYDSLNKYADFDGHLAFRELGYESPVSDNIIADNSAVVMASLVQQEEDVSPILPIALGGSNISIDEIGTETLTLQPAQTYNFMVGLLGNLPYDISYPSTREDNLTINADIYYFWSNFIRKPILVRISYCDEDGETHIDWAYLKDWVFTKDANNHYNFNVPCTLCRALRGGTETVVTADGETIIVNIPTEAVMDTIRIYYDSDNPDIIYHTLIESDRKVLASHDENGYATTTTVGNYSQDFINKEQGEYPYLYLGEIYKKDFDYSTLYGGTDENAIENINWVVCSEMTAMGEQITSSWGDTFYQRWDCLKTYPYSEEDTNGIVDILSFMVETHINLDGRSDVNRGITNILNARPTNWNLINTAYNQKDNFFNYKTLDEKYDLSKLGNQIAWSLNKENTADIDTWTNINLLNTLSLDGKYGKINKLMTMNNALIAFQDKAIAAINYNNRTSISTEEGTPIEVMNSGKVTGYSYVTTGNGCINKWSVVQGGSGIYFTDDEHHSIMRFGQNGIENLTSSKGMTKWSKHHTSMKVWKPLSDAIKAGYDSITNDVYFNTNIESLVFNEKLNNFTSYMPYGGYPLMDTVNGVSITAYTSNTLTTLGKMFEGQYNTDMFGNKYSYGVTYKVNPDPYSDKIFTNVEFVADVVDEFRGVDFKEIIEDEIPFSKISAWNEYQFGEEDLNVALGHSQLKKKFRFWRADIPRDKKSRYKMDRIRNSWCYLSFSKLPEDTHLMDFHQIIVKYFI